MRYPETTERSAECLRMALALMARHQAAFNPITYAVWYEYASGTSLPLKLEIDKLIADGNHLDEATTRRIYNEHIAQLDPATVTKLNSSFQQLVSILSESAAQASVEASRFGARLKQFGFKLQEPLAQQLLEEQVGVVLEDTRLMQRAILKLAERLEHSQSEVQRLQEELLRCREESQTDGLTGLPNRKAFDQGLDVLISDAAGRRVPPCLIMLDIDEFKLINDRFGHVLGDRVLRTIADVLKASVKGRDIVARYGGEEFALLLPDTPLGGAHVLAEQLREAVAQSRILKVNNDEIVGNITISAGLACYRNGESGARFIERSAEALYVSKKTGRNRLTVAG